MYEEIAQKKILVVGASRGIGRQLCHAIDGLGGHVIAAARDVHSLAENLQDTGIPASRFMACDIGNSEDISALVKGIEPVDALCITAGAAKLAPKHMIKRSSIDAQLEVNLAGPVDLISTMLRFKKLNTGASIVTTTASARYNSVTATVPYVASKNGLVAVSRSLAAEISSLKMRINSVSFDYVMTDMTKPILDHLEKTGTSEFQGIVGVSPVENSVVPYIYLISDASKWMTGQVVGADAGRRITRVVYG